jgi:membrane fusion protein, multidrug efflux system
MRRKIALAAIIVTVGGGYAYWGALRADSGPAQPAPVVPEVRTARAAIECLPIYVRGIGRVDPFKAVQLKSRVDGQIDRILFTEGAEIRQGEALVEIDPRPYQAAVAQAEGQLARDEAQLQAARADLARATELVRKGFASHQSYDQQTSLVAQFTASVKIDQALLETAKLNLGFATIRAPISGRIGKHLVDAGNIIHAADNTVLAEIDQLHPISIVLSVPQAARPAIQAAQQAGIAKVDAEDADNQQPLGLGDLTLIGNKVDSQTGTIELKASFANLDDALWPGQFVTARVVTATRQDAVAVPLAAIEPGPAGKFVYVVDDKSMVQPRDVRLGAPVDGRAVVESGLRQGEIVVLDQQDQLKPGMQVKTDEQRVEAAICALGGSARRS